MARLNFKSDEFQRMLTHMMKHERKIPYLDETTEDFGLWLVKDDGIYVMSPSAKRDKDGDGVHVIYADGYDRNEPEIWDKAHEVSADDFAEFIPLTKRMVQRLMETCHLEIGLYDTQIEVLV